jgi:hypothetical protein
MTWVARSGSPAPRSRSTASTKRINGTIGAGHPRHHRYEIARTLSLPIGGGPPAVPLSLATTFLLTGWVERPALHPSHADRPCGSRGSRPRRPAGFPLTGLNAVCCAGVAGGATCRATSLGGRHPSRRAVLPSNAGAGRD